MGSAMGIGASHGMGSAMGMHSIGMVGGRSFAAVPMSHAAFAPSFAHPHMAFAPNFAHPAFPHHAFHHHNRFNRFAYGGGGDYFYAGYDDCWRRVWTAYGPQWVNLCDYGY
jgi:hypothetical protein